MKRALEVVFWCVVALVGLPLFGGLFYLLVPKESPGELTVAASDGELIAARPAEIAPSGELAEVFALFSNATALQREEKERQIKGKIVQWRLPVYNVTEHGGFYVVQTKSQSGLVGAFCYVRASETSKDVVLRLREDDYVTCKGPIAGASMRNIEIKPAVLL
jgi:hypothetical protein